MPRCFLITVVALLSLNAPARGQDPNATPDQAAPRRPLGFRVFNNMDQPVAGLWEINIPEMPARRISIREAVAGNPTALVGVDPASGEELLRLVKRKEGIGFDGQLFRLFAPCGYDTLAVSEFVPLGDSAVLRFETTPPNAACPSIDSGRAGRFFAFSRRGGPLRLRAFSDISTSAVRETYSIGGDRPNAETTTELAIGGIMVEDGAELKFLRRVKAPLDGSFWIEVEAVVSSEAGSPPVRGFLKPDALRFVASLALNRVKPEPAP